MCYVLLQFDRHNVSIDFLLIVCYVTQIQGFIFCQNESIITTII